MRNLERELSTLVRKAVKELMLNKKTKVGEGHRGRTSSDYLGVPKYRYGEIEEKDQVGVVTGLAWTDVGGELLTIEGAMMPGKGRMTVTGNLRDVMKESISAAASYVRSRAIAFGIEPPLFEKRDIHVHVPEGATPKDGPSAGVAMVTAIVSVMTGIPVRRDVAMTGEITLRGRVLPIGGLKEKLLAAHRGGIKTVLIPEENAKDLVEISDQIKGGLEIIPVSRMDEVLAKALVAQARADRMGRGDREAGRRSGGRGRQPDRDRALNAADTKCEAAPVTAPLCIWRGEGTHASRARDTSERGRLAQLVERLLYTQDVGGSSPSSPTSLRGSAASAGKPNCDEGCPP